MLAGASAVLLADLHGRGESGTARRRGTAARVTGWQALTDLRWLLLVTIVAAVALVFMQATRRAPAIPVTLSLIVMLLGLVTVVALIYRVLINPAAAPAGGRLPRPAVARSGSRAAATCSLRQEGIARRDERRDIPIVRPGRGIES